MIRVRLTRWNVCDVSFCCRFFPSYQTFHPKGNTTLKSTFYHIPVFMPSICQKVCLHLYKQRCRKKWKLDYFCGDAKTFIHSLETSKMNASLKIHLLWSGAQSGKNGGGKSENVWHHHKPQATPIIFSFAGNGWTSPLKKQKTGFRGVFVKAEHPPITSSRDGVTWQRNTHHVIGDPSFSQDDNGDTYVTPLLQLRSA